MQKILETGAYVMSHGGIRSFRIISNKNFHEIAMKPGCDHRRASRNIVSPNIIQPVEFEHVVSLDDGTERSAAGALCDAEMKLEVVIMDGEEKLGVPVARRRTVKKNVHVLGHTEQFLPLLVTGVLHKEARRLALQALSHDVVFPNILQSGNPNPGAHTGSGFDQTVTLQTLQRRRNRQQAHLEFRGQLAPPQFRTGPQLPSKNSLSDRRVSPFRKAGRGMAAPILTDEH